MVPGRLPSLKGSEVALGLYRVYKRYTRVLQSRAHIKGP